MKNSPLPMILLVVLAVSALFSLGLCWASIGRSRELNGLRYETSQIENIRRIGTGLAVDAIEYSKTHPDFVPILEAAGLRQRTNAPAIKPASK